MAIRRHADSRQVIIRRPTEGFIPQLRAILIDLHDPIVVGTTTFFRFIAAFNGVGIAAQNITAAGNCY